MPSLHNVVKQYYKTQQYSPSGNSNVKLLMGADHSAIESKEVYSVNHNQNVVVEEVTNIKVLQTLAKAYIDTAEIYEKLTSQFSTPLFISLMRELSQAPSEELFFEKLGAHLKTKNINDIKAKLFIEFLDVLMTLAPKRMMVINSNLVENLELHAYSSPIDSTEIRKIFTLFMTTSPFDHHVRIEVILKTLHSAVRNLPNTLAATEFKVELLKDLIKINYAKEELRDLLPGIIKDILFNLPESAFKAFTPYSTNLAKILASIPEEKQYDTRANIISSAAKTTPDILARVFPEMIPTLQVEMINEVIAMFGKDKMAALPYLVNLAALFSHYFEQFNHFKLAFINLITPHLMDPKLMESAAQIVGNTLSSLPNDKLNIDLKQKAIEQLLILLNNPAFFNPALIGALCEITLSLPPELVPVHQKAIQFLLNKLESELSWDNKTAIIKALGHPLNEPNLDKRALVQLVNHLQDENDRVKETAAESLSKVIPLLTADQQELDKAITTLITLLGKTQNHSVRVTQLQISAAETLGIILPNTPDGPLKNKAVDALISDLDDDDVDFKITIANTLSKTIACYPKGSRWSLIEKVAHKLLSQMGDRLTSESATQALIALCSPLSESQKNHFVYGLLVNQMDYSSPYAKTTASEIHLKLAISEICNIRRAEINVAKQVEKDFGLHNNLAAIVASYCSYN